MSCLLQITAIVILWGRCSEIKYEITFGEKKNVGSGYSASARLLESAARFDLSVTSQQLDHLYSSFYYYLSIVFSLKVGLYDSWLCNSSLGRYSGGVRNSFKTVLKHFSDRLSLLLSERLETFCKQATVTK